MNTLGGSVSNCSRLLRDAKLFNSRLGQIDGAGNTGSYLIQLVEAKTIAQAPQSAPEEKEKDEPALPAETAKGSDDAS